MTYQRKRPLTLTAKHRSLLTYIVETQRLKDRPPSYEELKKFLETTSCGVVAYWLQQLEDLGLIRRLGTRGRRGIEIKVYDLTDEQKNLIRQLKETGVHLSVICKEWALI